MGPGDGQQMAVLLDRKAFEATLPDMAATPVVTMVALHMTGHPPLLLCTCVYHGCDKAVYALPRFIPHLKEFHAEGSSR